MDFSVNAFDAIDQHSIRAASVFLRSHFPESPLVPMLCEEQTTAYAKLECDVPTSAFKIRGGLVYFHWLQAAHPNVDTVVAATRGNHGQSVAMAAAANGYRCRIVVPIGNSPLKNQAMQRLGAELIEHGGDFAESLEFAAQIASDDTTHFVPSFDWKLVLGVATYGYELFSAAPQIDAVYVPIGLGSGICGTLAARRATSQDARIIGVVAANAPVYASSFAAGEIVSNAEIPRTIADGVACRVPHPAAFATILRHVDEITMASEDQIRGGIAELFRRTGRRVEGAGALAWAACRRQLGRFRHPAVIVSGGNIDDETFDRSLQQVA